ncbi:MAG: transposase [Proteobacteria bacterium]|nr:transposase [Pseudomonadota bacterium]
MGTKFSKSFKMQAVKKAITRKEGISVKDIADELSMGYSTLQKWVVQRIFHKFILFYH